MNDKISLLDFANFVQLASMKYPNATVVSIGNGCANNTWYYALFLDVNGAEIRYEIPMCREEGDNNDERY